MPPLCPGLPPLIDAAKPVCSEPKSQILDDVRSACENGAPDTIRTCGLRLRRAMLYPAELRVHLLLTQCLREFLASVKRRATFSQVFESQTSFKLLFCSNWVDTCLRRAMNWVIKSVWKAKVRVMATYFQITSTAFCVLYPSVIRALPQPCANLPNSLC